MKEGGEGVGEQEEEEEEEERKLLRRKLGSMKRLKHRRR